jgi:tRNA G18 (ribose-2'-O)-methylase SpoU
VKSENLVTVEGRWAVEALLQSEFIVGDVVVETGRHESIRESCDSAGVPFRELSREKIAEESGYAFHRGVFARAERPRAGELDQEFLERATRLVIPYGIADPGNLGTIIRTAVAFGADGIALESGMGADVYSRKSIRASATGIFRVPVFEVPSIEAALSSMQEVGFACLGLGLAEDAKPLAGVTRAGKMALLLGSEADGLPPDLDARCDERIRIPIGAGMDSLNVATAAAIACYELFEA